MEINAEKDIKMFCGDCAEKIKLIPADSVDLVVTSPPYDTMRTCYNNAFDLGTITTELMRVLKPGGTIVWVVADETINGSETGTSFRQALKFMDAGFKLHDTMIWEKDGFTDTGSLRVRYANNFEYMFVFSKEKPKTFNPIKDRQNANYKTKKTGNIRQKDGSKKPMSSIGKQIAQYGQRFNVWKINTCKSAGKDRHPAQFPLQLAKDHIYSWSNAGDTVMDIFMGSGTTGVASVNMGRKFIGIEIDKDYFEMAKRRIETAERPLF